MIIDQQLLDNLSAQAKANPRLRQSYDLRTEATEACLELTVNPEFIEGKD